MNRWILSWRDENSSECKRQVEINILIGREFTGFIWLAKAHPYNYYKGFLPLFFFPLEISLSSDRHLGGVHLKPDSSYCNYVSSSNSSVI